MALSVGAVYSAAVVRRGALAEVKRLFGDERSVRDAKAPYARRRGIAGVVLASA